MTRIKLTLNRPGDCAFKNHANGRPEVNLSDRALGLIPLIALQLFVTASAFAQTRGGAITVRYTAFSPFIALLAGILILIVPRLLNYIVALYLILIGLIGIFGV